MKNKDVSIIGAGRFGSFFGNLLSPFFDVLYFDISQKEGERHNFGSAVECLGRKYIFLTIPISEIENFLLCNLKHISTSSILIDMSSLKLRPKELFEKYLSPGHCFLLTHPLFGPDSARESHKGHTIAVTGGRLTRADEDFILKIFTDLLSLSIVTLTAEEHDYLMAYNLTLMHHIGRAFNEMGLGNLKLKMRSLTEIDRIREFVMNDSDRLFADLYAYNPYSEKIKNLFLESFSKTAPRI